MAPFVLGDVLDVAERIGTVLGATFGASLMVKKVWNGSTETLHRLEQGQVSLSNSQVALSQKVDAKSDELHDRISGVDRRLARIEGSRWRRRGDDDFHPETD